MPTPRVRFLRFGEVIDQLPYVDDADALERSRSNRALRSALEIARPRNWWGIGAAPTTLLDISHEDGLPLAWVPRNEIVREFADAKTSEARQTVLRERREDILDDVVAAIDECQDSWLCEEVALAKAAADAFANGHHEAAMALAVSLGEPLATWASTRRVISFESKEKRDAWERKRKKDKKYRWAKAEYAVIRADLRALDVKRAILIAPIPRFYTPWFPDSGSPPPSQLSRHVVAHQPNVSHFSVDNALKSLMLIASIIREQEEWCKEVRHGDHLEDQ